MLITTFLDSLSSTRNALMALGPAASTPVQHLPQHAVQNPSHLPAALAPNTPFPSPHTTRPWCEITGQDQASRIRSRGDIGKASGTNNPPTTHLSITDILMFHAHCEWISGCDWIGCIWAVPESWLALPGKRLQRCNLCSTTPSGSQTQYLPWWDRGGSPMAPALRQMETTMLPEIDVLQWAQGVTAYCSTSLLL